MPVDHKTIRATVAQAIEYELSCWPPRQDGTKAPEGSWGAFTKRLPTREELTEVYARERCGVGLICGGVSHGLECLDIEDRDTWNTFVGAMADAGISDLGREVARGYMEYAPSGGVHWLWHTETPQGNTKLARHADGRVRIETRGEGGYVIVAPSFGPVHPSGNPWVLAHGGIPTITKLSAGDRETLLTVCRNLDEGPRGEPGPEVARTPYEDKGRPGDDFNRRADWAVDVLTPAGWTKVGQIGDQEYWRRPDKPANEKGHSAVLHIDTGIFVPFSTSTPFEPERGYTKFSALAKLMFNNDFRAAKEHVESLGYKAREQAAVLPVFGQTMRANLLGGLELPDIATLPILGRDGFFIEGGSNLLYGFPKAGKTDLSMALVREWISQGRRVCYFSEESLLFWKSRLAALGEDWDYWEPLLLSEAMGWGVVKVLANFTDDDVVFVDTIRSVTGYRENKVDEDVGKIVEPLILATRERGATLIAGYHARKMPGEDGVDISGHHSLFGAFDRAVQLKKLGGEENEKKRKLKVFGRLLNPDQASTLVYEMTGPCQFRVLDGETVVAMAAPQRECAASDCELWFTPARKDQDFCTDPCRRREGRRHQKLTESE